MAATKTRSAIGRSLDVYYRDQTRRARMDDFHASLIDPGALVFDIGSHVGDRADSFVRLGARVVALEPQPDVFRALRLICRLRHGHNSRITLRNEAVGAQAGVVAMYVNAANPTVSTLSPELVHAAQSSPQWQGQIWDQSIDVPVTTLDALIAEFGVPDFVKIDVEGFELDVLKGLGMSLPAVSFEFTTIQRDVASACIDRMSALGAYGFNYSLGEDHRLQSKAVLSPAQIKTEINSLPASANSGDIFAFRAEME